ncbi:MAG: hypothetical protein PHI53_01430 [Candidatus Pacebacteria bacterium]|nr:hypothetical protein [Candidatus Paceibacterota bacterium]
MKKLKIFISHHPSNLLLYRNMSYMAKRLDKDTKAVLFKINHVYYKDFDLGPYLKHFDEILEFDFITYSKNIISSWYKIFKFLSRFRKAMKSFENSFDEIDLFLDNSAWLPLNIILYNLSRFKKVKNINRFSYIEPEDAETKVSRMKTFLCSLYSLPFNCYKVKVITSTKGTFSNFVYSENPIGRIIKIANPKGEFLKKISSNKEEYFLPYPIFSKNIRLRKKAKKDMVVVFGLGDIFSCYPEYMSEQKVFLEKMEKFFKALEKRYKRYKLYYKPHPQDERGVFIAGIDIKKYRLFDNSASAQYLIDKYSDRIKAVYTFLSTSAVFSSFYSIPSYTFYRYIYNSDGVKRFDNMYDHENIKSDFLFHIFSIEEIGKIDNLKSANNFDLKIYQKILNV